MKRFNIIRHNRFPAALCVAALCSTLFASPAMAAGKGNLGNPGVLPPAANAYGKSYAEWSAEWWSWALSIPAAENPLFDETGALTGAHQVGPVWFLAGVFNESGTAERTATVPAGKALFFPVLNVECSSVEDPEGGFYGATEEEQRACARFWGDFMTDLAATIDGRPVENVAAYRVSSPQISFTLPEDNIFGLPGGTSGTAVGDGVHLLLRPLSVGEHTIHFTGSYVIPGGNEDGSDWVFTLDITYHLTVVPGK